MSMTLEAGDRRLALRTGESDGLPVLAPLEGKCTPLEAGERRVGLITGATEDGIPIIAWGQQKCKAGTSTFEAGKRYLGLVTGVTEDGIPIIASWCEDCEGPPVDSCDCVVCCNLNATVQVGSSGDPHDWSVTAEVILVCHGTMEVHSGFCCENDLDPEDVVCHTITATIDEKDTIGSPVAYSIGGASGTREAKSSIWVTENFELEGETYRLNYWRVEGTIYQTSPSVVTTPFCATGWCLQHLATDVDYGSYWELVSGDDLADILYGGTETAQSPYAWAFQITDDNPYDPGPCAEGYSVIGELVTGQKCGNHPLDESDLYTSGSTDDETYTNACPPFILSETWDRLITDPDDCEHRLPCARVMILGGCYDYQPCTALIVPALYPILDYEVTGACMATSGSEVLDGAGGTFPDCGTTSIPGGCVFDEHDLFYCGTGQVFSMGGTDEAAEPPIQWGSADPATPCSNCCVAELSFSFCCMERDNGDPYIAVFAQIVVYSWATWLIQACTVDSYYYKSRDIAVTNVDGYMVYSVTELEPYGEDHYVNPDPCTSPTCCTEAPKLSLALKLYPVDGCPDEGGEEAEVALNAGLELSQFGLS